MNITKNLQGWLPVAGILLYIGLTKGVAGILNVLLLSIIVIPVAWILIRVITGTWNIKELSKNSAKPESPEYKKNEASFWKYAAKLFLIAVVVVVGFLWLFIIVMKKYFLN
jgi:ABC-type dipeptide/oligopeptide/nickel transport system permease component